MRITSTTFSIKSFFGASLGTMVEYYDYVLFSTFLPIISPIFFPGGSPYEAMVKGFFILSIPMFFRPFGGLFFGYLGDHFGRRKALLSSMYGIAIATLMIGLTPSYAAWGVMSIVMIVVAKSVQLACFGGEFNGAGIYVTEHALPGREGMMGGFLGATTIIGSLSASLIGVVCTLPNMPAWSWRVAFLIGALIGVFAIMYRKNLLESPHFIQADKKQHSLKKLLKQFPREMLAGIFMGGSACVPFSSVQVFVMPVLTAKGYLTQHEFMLIQTLLIMIGFVALITASFIANKFSASNMMRFGTLFLILFAYPLMRYFDQSSLFAMILVSAVIIIANELFLGPMHAYYKKLFPMQYRYRGSSLSFCIGISFFGGLTQIIENYLYQLTDHLSAASLWVVLVSLGSFLTIGWANKKQLSVKNEIPSIAVI